MTQLSSTESRVLVRVANQRGHKPLKRFTNFSPDSPAYDGGGKIEANVAPSNSFPVHTGELPRGGGGGRLQSKRLPISDHEFFRSTSQPRQFGGHVQPRANIARCACERTTGGLNVRHKLWGRRA